jgi:hypothetical protein
VAASVLLVSRKQERRNPLRKAGAVDYSEITAQYDKINRELEAEINAKYEAVRTQRQDAFNALGKKYNTEVSAIDAERREILKERLSQTAADADPVVFSTLLWMVDQGLWNNYTNECRAILKLLPLDWDGLRALKSTHGWCSSYDGYLLSAAKAGTIPGVTDRQQAELKLDIVIGSSVHYDRERKAVREAVAALLAVIDGSDAPVSEEKDAPVVKKPVF